MKTLPVVGTQARQVDVVAPVTVEESGQDDPGRRVSLLPRICRLYGACC